MTSSPMTSSRRPPSTHHLPAVSPSVARAQLQSLPHDQADGIHPGTANIQITSRPMLPVAPSIASQPPIPPQMLSQSTSSPAQWQQNVPRYGPPPHPTSLPPGPALLGMQRSYLEQATALIKPPPPYGYSLQVGMLAQTPPTQSYAQPQPLWGLPQQQPLAMGPAPPPSQHLPMSWMNVRPREPPQYVDHMVQQHIMSGPSLPPPPPQQTPQYPQIPQQHPHHSPGMSKSQSDTKFHSGSAPRPHLERRYNSQGTPRRAYPPSYRPLRRGRHGIEQQKREESFEPEQPPMWPQDVPPGDGSRVPDGDGRTRLVELARDPTGSLGINVGQMGEEGGPTGVYVKSLSHNCKAVVKGRLNLGDQILEVNGIDLRHATQAEAVNIIKNVISPVRILVQSLSDCLGGPKHARPLALQESPEHSHHNSWAIEEKEDPDIREEFPEVEGHLFDVELRKGKTGLGLSIVESTQEQMVGGIVIMWIQPGGVADQCGKIKWGDMILKVNNTCVIGMSRQQVQEMLARSPPLVRFVLVRQHMNSGPTEQLPSQPSTTSQAGGDNHRPHHHAFDDLSHVRSVTVRRDNEKGLGFTMAEGERGDNSIVLVTSIIPGGPAEEDGQLQKGDQILSVDGQQIVGYPYEKAKHLLQQAKARGSVTLIVASCSLKQDGGMKGGGDQGDVVVLRKKKRASNSLKSSRRRPVSVDYDPMAVTPSAQGPAGAVLRDTTGSSEMYKRHSNRNSHPLTEREVEQGFRMFGREGTAITPGSESEIVIFKDSQPLGLIIVGGTDTFLHGIYIEKVIPDSPAAKNGRLQPGDRLMKVNNVSLESANREDATKALQHPAPFVSLVILREPAGIPKIPLPEDSSSTTSLGIETVELLKPERGGLGLLICEEEDQPGVYVQEVVENEAAYLDQRIRAGDKILVINGQDMSSARQTTVYRTLQVCRGRVTLTVRHPVSTNPTPPTQLEYPQSSDHDPFQPRPPPEYPYPPAAATPVRLPDRYPPPYSSASASTTSASLAGHPSRPLQTTAGVYGNGADYLTSHHHQGMFRGERRAPSPPPPPPPMQDGREKIKVIRLHRGPSGLGFTIVGGMNSPHGDLPIFIKRVFDEGAAGRDGRLRMGDQLLAVNGIPFENVTHQFAAERLKYLQGDVELTVVSPG